MRQDCSRKIVNGSRIGEGRHESEKEEIEVAPG
jgi:hypothetical protein